MTTTRTLRLTRQFKRDYRRERKGRHRQTLDAALGAIVQALAADQPPDPRHRYTANRTFGVKALILPRIFLSKSPCRSEPSRFRFPGCNCAQENRQCQTLPSPMRATPSAPATLRAYTWRRPISTERLSDARVKALRSRPSAYDIRDAKLKGFGVRVLPSGAKRFFIHTQHRGTRVWKMVGDASAITVDEARARAASLLAAIRCDADAPASPDATRFEAVAEAVFRRYARVWKPQTLNVNRHYLRRQILPRFEGTQIAAITPADVKRWFASLRATPVTADRSMPVLSVIMTEAERMGYRPEGSNPCRGIRRNRRKGRERFLSDAEIGRLGATLLAHESERPLQVAAVRLLLLTGCRRSEVLTLRRSDYREGRLFLPDRKTGDYSIPMPVGSVRGHVVPNRQYFL